MGKDSPRVLNPRRPASDVEQRGGSGWSIDSRKRYRYVVASRGVVEMSARAML